RTASPADSSNVGPPENRPTGAVTRQSRNIDSTPATPDLSAPSNDSSKPTRSRVTTPASPSTPDEDRTDRRPALPDRRTSDNARPAETSDTPPERVVRPVQRDDDGEKRSRDKRERIETSPPVQRPVDNPPSPDQPRAESPAEPPSRPSRERAEPTERSEPRSAPRYEPRSEQSRSESPQRYAPPARSYPPTPPEP